VSRIAGIFDPTQPRALSAAAMLRSMASAVGGSERQEKSARCVLGHWGWQRPSLARLGAVTIVLDGAIYNRSDFGRVESDAALLAQLYDRYGLKDALRKMNGDFALAVYDEKTNTLHLARDRFGVKPLYWARLGDAFAFASRPAGLFAIGVPRNVNREYAGLFAGSHYRTFDNSPEKSPYEAIAQVPAATLLTIQADQIRKERYFDLVEELDFVESEQTLADRYRAVLLDAVAIRVRNATRPIFTLSGGMDSSSVLACAVASSGAKQHAISTVYEDATYDESAEIASMLDQTVEAWHPVRIGTPDLAAVVERMVRAHDEPVATATWLSHYLLCEQTRQLGFATLLGGLGGDELNAGEFEYFFFFFADLKRSGDEAALAHETERWIAHHDHPIFKKSPEVMQRGLDRLVDLSTPGRCLPDRGRLFRYADAINREYFDLSKFEPVMDTPFSSYLKNRTYQDIYRETAPCCLRAADRQATAFDLDVIWPFFDHRVVELMFRAPNTMKIRSGVTKRLLREAMKGILPEETRTRVKKTGWNAPAHVWFTGRGRELVLDRIGSRSFRERGIYNTTRVRALLDEHDRIVSTKQSVDNHMMFFWQLLNLDIWFDQLQSTESRPK
jgi:asparagine synthase (glutamine-hydrolysing)